MTETVQCPPIPGETVLRWREMLRLMAKELRAPIAMIARQSGDRTEVFCTNGESSSPFREGEHAGGLLDLECKVIEQRKALYFHDLSAEPQWSGHPVAAAGLRYFLGYPLLWPNGEVYAALSIHDRTPNAHADEHRELLAGFRHGIERDLLILQQQAELSAEAACRRRAEAELASFTPKEFSALWRAAKAVLAHRKFDAAARVIFDEACGITGAKSGYVALLSDHKEVEVQFLEPGGLPCTVDPNLPMPIRGLRAVAIRNAAPVYENSFMGAEYVKLMPDGHVALRNVMFAPLNVGGETVGLMGLANKDGDFTEYDATVASALGEVAAIALVNSRNLDLVEERTAKLRESQEEVLQLNKNLEMRVAERTEDLESFSYSVSHNLRAPLRAIDGFSHILIEEYRDKLDDEGKRLLNVVRNNVTGMARLIEDILALSCAGRKNFTPELVNIDDLAKTTLEELKPSMEGRDVKVELGALPPAQGDMAMLRQVFMHLIRNAIKFTRHNDCAVINISGRLDDNENVYCIKDNGTGFDMQYSDRLFAGFQRLHGVEEFEGTGIGLATVKRIVTRHGGRVWAESKPGEGTALYFTLPARKEEEGDARPV